MRRRAKIGTGTTILLLCCLLAAAPVWAASAAIGGARPAGINAANGSTAIVTAQTIPSSFAEVVAAFTASPTAGGLGDAIAASRDTFSSAETIEFNGVLLESGLAGTTRNLALYLFDLRGGLASGPFLLNNVVAPDDRTDFFMLQEPGSLGVTGRFNWVMTISDVFGGFFVTGLHGIEIQ
ncbi:MAG: hypothetical protein C3F12_04700 [Candidatus Methylomirabilota bacterium]|nr:hypothetical protein [candidate division NC10 bacterium]PWB47280.1 MAG: hypothetical protein C3F12_04700 [candidate division NC10 bacterium]